MGKQTKFVFVTGGVVSSIGKGLTSASIGALMEARGLRVTHMKLDPYINVDPGTMSPYQHGEVFVTDDGAETDLDLGHYERFSSVRMTRQHNLTSGRVYEAVIQKERRGEYLGATVQVIPHVTDEIKGRIRAATEEADIAIIEVGGTVGDIESLPFLEALRQLKIESGTQNAVSVHVTLVPFIPTAGELKTKPTQHAVKEMREIGIQPDILICRSDRPLSRSIKEKISLFSNVPVDSVVAAVDVGCIYELPLALQEEGLDNIITDRLNIWSRRPDLTEWRKMVRRFTDPGRGGVRIGIVGKYVHLKDAYKSLHESLVHGGMANDVRVDLEYIDSEEVEKVGPEAKLAHLDAILVPGGFGDRGSEGKIETIRYARTHGVPFFGICLGMQLAVVEFARTVCKLDRANSTEFDKDCPNPVIDLMLDQRTTTQKGGTMRLGAYPCQLLPGTLAAEAYGTVEVSERHRHRYEVSNAFRDELSGAGLVLSGTSPDGRLVEMVELKNHPYFVGCQFHPEFKSRPMAPHPLFSRFVKAALERREVRTKAASEKARLSASAAPPATPAPATTETSRVN
jgi:CTP synthase